MNKKNTISQLQELASTFGKEAAEKKLNLLQALLTEPTPGVSDLETLCDALCFMAAYPDSKALLNAVHKARDWARQLLHAGIVDPEDPALENGGFPGAINRNEYSLPWISRLLKRMPDCFEIDWQEFEWEGQERLLNALGLITTSAECQGLDDISIDLPDWFALGRSPQDRSDLEFLLSLLENSSLPPQVKDYIFESCRIPIRYSLLEPGTGRCEVHWKQKQIHFQRRVLDRKRPQCEKTIRTKFDKIVRLSQRKGIELIHQATLALSARNLEIRTLTYANPKDVNLVECGRGLTVALVGVIPLYRDPLECHYFCFLMKNGVPIAYGPGSVSLGCCEIGLNLFPEFRGAEVQFLYPQLMRALHQVIGANYFFLTPYGMGENNPAAIKTGAFWFYRKLGFRASNPKVEELALAEEEKMKETKDYRSDRKMLHRLSRTSAYFDLSGGRNFPLDLGAIGLAMSRYTAETFGGNRSIAVRDSIKKVAKSLGVGSLNSLSVDEKQGWEILAPIVVAIPDLKAWSDTNKTKLLRILRAKGGQSETRTDRLLQNHTPLLAALRVLAKR